MVARILAVEDDHIQARILEFQLRKDYEVTLADSGETCLKAAAGGGFDVILLDVMLPGITGYEVCRRLKADEATRDIPVIFISANFTMDDRLQGFEAGGFDYLVKPVVKTELTRKIEILLAHQEDKRLLKTSADFAASTAMTAMTSAAEQGLVLQFMKKSFGCNGYPDLADAMIEATRQFGLDGLVQVRGRYGTVCRSPQGSCTPLEASILANFGSGDRIVDLKNRTAISYERASMLLRNMPTDEPERYGRLKDHLTALLEGADARVLALDMDLYLAREAKRMVEAVQAISHTLLEANRRTQELHEGYGAVFSRLTGDLEQAVPLLELSASQERMLEGMLQQASAEYVALADQETAVDRILLEAMEALQKVAYRVGDAP